MVNRRSFFVLILTTTLAVSVSLASATDIAGIQRAPRGPITTNQSPQLSGPTAALFVAGGRLLNIFRVVNGLGRVDFPTRGNGYQTYLQDSPDPYGIKGSRLPNQLPPPSWSSSRR